MLQSAFLDLACEVNFYSVPQMMQFAKQVSYKRMTTEALKKLTEANVRRAEAAAA